MPHLTVHAVEEELVGQEEALIAALSDAVVAVYGEWARAVVVVLLVGVPRHRWGVGGAPVPNAAPIVTVGIREAAFTRADAAAIVEGLVRRVTAAVTTVLGGEAGAGTQVELQATPAGRTAVGGVLVD